jgi:general secretion pathway protein E
VSYPSALEEAANRGIGVVLTGEIAASDTLDAVAAAVRDGRLVLSKLTTIDTTTALERLFELGASAEAVAEVLRLVVAMRLVRVVCPHCRRKVDTSAETKEMLEKATGEYVASLWEGKGCRACRETGYLGRTGLFEILKMTEKTAALLRDGAPPDAVARAARAAGMRTLWEDGLAKAREGITTLDEVRKATRPPVRGVAED